MGLVGFDCCFVFVFGVCVLWSVWVLHVVVLRVVLRFACRMVWCIDFAGCLFSVFVLIRVSKCWLFGWFRFGLFWLLGLVLTVMVGIDVASCAVDGYGLWMRYFLFIV